MSDLHQRVTQCFLNVFPNLRPEDMPRASMASLPAWDSIAHVILLSSIAEEFGFELDLDAFEELVSYPLIIEYVGKK